MKHGMAQANPDWLSFVQGFPAMIFWQQGQDESILNLTAYMVKEHARRWPQTSKMSKTVAFDGAPSNQRSSLRHVIERERERERPFLYIDHRFFFVTRFKETMALE